VNDEHKTTEQLLGELLKMRQRIAELELSEAERKRAEEALEASEQRYRELINTSVGAVISVDSDMNIVLWNPAAESIFGYSAAEMLGQSVMKIVPPRYGQAKEKGFARFRNDGSGVVIGEMLEFAGLRKDGTEVPVEISVSARKAGDTYVATAIVRDITGRKLAEEALAAERERLAVTLRSIGDGVITTDTEGRVVLLNRVAEELTGWSQDEAVGLPLEQVFLIINEKSREPCESPVKRVLEAGAIVGLANSTVLIGTDGTQRIIEDSAAPIRGRDSNVIGVVLVFRDITEKRRTEQELLRASKLDSLAVLAGGIAHDFNNILTGIIGNISLARTHVNAEDRIFPRLTQAEKASIQAKDLTEQLLTFAKGGAPVKKTASLADVIRDSAEFALRGSNVRCQFFVPDDLWPVEIDEGQMSQVINNLIINADQAMPDGGIMTVRAENVPVGADHFPPLGNERYVKVCIDDQGVGIAPSHLQRVFDPFFTTKQKGSGLGLATAYSVVRNHDGHMSVESEMGVGTTFSLYLPASERATPATLKRSAQEAARLGEGRVLVMDDEEMIRDLATEMLTYLGYEVALASDGAEAIELYTEAKESGQPFDAVVMDLTIPGATGGKEAVKKLVEIDPEVKAIVCSGYLNDPIMANFSEHGFCACIAKPYRIEELGEALHSVIIGNGE